MASRIQITILLSALFATTAWATPSFSPRCHATGQNNTQCQYASSLYAMTNMPYALCSKALCTINNYHSNLATCTCPVFGSHISKASWQNVSLGPKAYQHIKPTYSHRKLLTVTSTFSLANMQDVTHPTGRNCQFSTPHPWANCFGIRCKVTSYYNADGKPVTIATCQCPIVRSKTFSSTGPNSINQCTTEKGHAWSAASSTQGKGNIYIMQDMYRRYTPGAK